MSEPHTYQVAVELRRARSLLAELPASNALDTLYQTLRRVRGSLELLGLPGTALLTQELCETVLYAARQDQNKAPSALDGVARGLDALVERLDESCDAHAENPRRMRRLVDELRRARGVEPAAAETFITSPADAGAVALPATEQVALDNDLRDAARRLRAAYQRGLVEWLRGMDRPRAFWRIDAVVTELEALCKPYPLSTLWWVARAAVACVREEGSGLDEVLKPAFSKLDRQIKYLTERGAKMLADPPPPTLLEQLLSGIALGTHDSDHVRAVCTAFNLRGLGSAGGARERQTDTPASAESPPVVDVPQPLPHSDTPPCPPVVDATFVEETDELLEALRRALPAMGPDGGIPARVVFTTARACFGELARLARGIGSNSVAELAAAFEALLDGVDRQNAHEVSAVLYQLVCEGCAQVEVLVQGTRAGLGDDGSWRDLVERAQSLLGQAQPLPGATQPVVVDQEVPFIDDSALLMIRSADVLSRWCDDTRNAEYLAELRRGLYALGRDSELGKCTGVSELCHALDALLGWLEAGTQTLAADDYIEPVARAHEMLCIQIAAVRAGRPIPDASDLARALSALLTTTGQQNVGVSPDPSAPAAGQPRATGPERLEDVVTLTTALNTARLQVEQHSSLMRENLDALARSVRLLRKRVQTLPVDAAPSPPSPPARAGSMSASLRAAEIDLTRRELESSAEDIDNLHELMAGLNDQSRVLLDQQAKLNLDLQRGLMVSRSVPVASLAGRFRQLVETTAAYFNKHVELVIVGEECEVDHSLCTQLVAPVEQLLRNAVEHGVEQPSERGRLGKPVLGTVEVDVKREGGDLLVSVSDDGSGFDVAAIETLARERGLFDEGTHREPETLCRLVLQPGLSSAPTCDPGNTRGTGLTDVVTAVERCRGVLTIRHQPGQGASFTLRVPATLAMAEVLLVEAAGERLAIPVNAVESVASMSRQDAEREMASEIPMFAPAGKVLHPLAYLGQIFDTHARPSDPNRQRQAVVVVKSAYRRLALMVDELQGRVEVMLDALSPPLGSIPLVSATTLLGDGRVTLVLDAGTLVRNLTARDGERVGQRDAAAKAPTVMVVDESRAIRRETGQLLRRNGMQVLTASDGVEALRLLRERCPDVMLLDTDVRGISGIELTNTLRDDSALGALPIVMLVSGATPPDDARTSRLGITQWLGKPFREGELLAAIDGVLR